MNIYAYFTLCFGFTSLIVAFFVWLRLGSVLGLRYFFFSACAGIWGMIVGICMLNDVTYETALLSARISNGVATFIASGWFHFTVEFSQKKDRLSKTMMFVLYAGSFLVLGHMFSPDFIPSLRKIDVFNYYPEAKNWVYKFFTIHFFVGVSLGFLNLFLYRRRLTVASKKSCDGLIIATMSGFAGGGFSFLTAFGFSGFHHWLLLMPLYPIVMAISMMRFDLFSAENLAEAAHKDKLAALGMVTASMNHEIRSPLFLMRGMIETEGKDSDLGKKLLSQINRVTEIVSRLTHFAKKGVDEEAKIEAIDLKEILSDIRPLFQHQLNYQNIEYTQDIPVDLPKVLADRRYLEEILFNLILNACQALKNTPNPKITLTGSVLGTQSRGLTPMVPNLSLGSRSSIPGPAIAIAIADNGPGIALDQQKNIFKPFHTTKSEGTGLGLYITKQLVEKCGGKIELQSELNKGAQFSVNLKAL